MTQGFTIGRRGALALPLVGLAATARAQGNWPTRPVRFIVSFTPGGTTDIIARLLGATLTETWGQSVVIENRPGAGGNIGSEHVARSVPDGYTLLVGSVGPLAVNQSLVKNMPYDTLRDFAPITLLAGVPNILVVPAASPIRDVPGLVAAAKARPGQLSYGSTGVGTSAHLSGVMLDQMAGTQTLHVPYRGAVALNDLLAGRVDFMFATIPSVIGHIRDGRLRPLAVSSTTRSRSNPDVPTMVELGYPDFSASSWFGMVAPAGTPPAIIEKITTDVHAALALPRNAQSMIDQGADPVGNGPDAFRAFMAEEISRWREIVRLAGALPE
ncbi:Bug family tripartite tricarboxylate transporter substrate binding protein [Falsiroseomonas sp. E2-1-a20]|uniref:Bug family tripartite tricarboxylate transporter substrate binding protein n=1 Tax=Falsiroseomonas sp. E2-1-a20 TaxID=3239300 RepID=UPI003F32CB8C